MNTESLMYKYSNTSRSLERISEVEYDLIHDIKLDIRSLTAGSIHELMLNYSK